ncbi:MAG: hypothetical protein KTR25_02915, partial [Myxococcales bacterium]|nr:hypothetical protein [Myxococcales bacterium]
MGVACSLVGITAPTAAHAAGMFGVDTNKTPSVITYGFRGMGTGALLGLSASYLVIRNSDSDDDLTLFLTTTGISALVGAGTGIAIGLFDLKSNRPGVGGIMLRDTLYGTLLGGLVGLTVGGIVALNGGEGEDLALGASIGSLVGAVQSVAQHNTTDAGSVAFEVKQADRDAGSS